MKRWGQNRKVVPARLCNCVGGSVRDYFRRCHGESVCCNVVEGDECMEVGKW